MKPKFGDKKAKNKQKKAKAKAKKAALKAAGGADADMEVQEETTTAPQEEIDYTRHDDKGVSEEGAKNRLKSKMQVKRALKLKVQQLKHTRSKLTKLPGAGAAAKQGAKKQLNKEIKELVKEQTAGKKSTKLSKKLKKASKGKEAVAAAAPDSGTMEQ